MKRCLVSAARAGLLAAAGLATVLAAVAWTDASAAAPADVRFKKIVIDKTFRSEGVAIGDCNHDGRMDILVGDVWYEQPDLKADPAAAWPMHEIRKVGAYDPKGYSQCFNAWVQDVNGDGWLDQVVVNWPGRSAFWYENPKNAPGHWKERLITRSACNESPQFRPLVPGGRAVLVCGSGGKMVWFSPPQDLEQPWDLHVIAQGQKVPGTGGYSHGLGVGDLSGDGRPDVIVAGGYWEAPADPAQPDWPFHATKASGAFADMLAYDLDGDGASDLIATSAHGKGMWWYEQTKGEAGAAFVQHEFSKAFSQTHSVMLADINRDGIMDLVTGKRFWAHGPKGDVEPDAPAVVAWFEVRRPEKGKVEFVLHEIDNDSGIGTQFEVADFNGDGRLDVITSNKKGVYLFLQE
jgi:hypothetical protein